MKPKWVALGSLANVTSGGTPDRQRPDFWGGDVPWVKTTLIQNCEINREDIDETITEAGLKKSSSRIIPAGSILLAMIGQGRTRGQVALLKTDAAINQNCAALIVKAGVDARYIYQQLLFRYDELRNASNSSGQQNLNAQLIRSFKLPDLHPKAQVRIGAILASWDAAIEKTERLIAAKEQRFSGLMNRLVVRRARTDPTFPLKPLHRIADRVQRKPDGNALPLLTISSASGFVRQEDKYSRYMAGESAKTYTLLRRGEFAYNKGNSLRYEFGCVFPLLDYDAALVPSVYVSFRLREGVHPAYLQHVFAADYLKPQLRALVKTGVRNNGLLNIRPDEFMATSVPLPPIALQQQIAAVLDEAREEIRLLALKLEALRVQKRGLMQKLLTGQWRVPIDKGVTA